MFARNKIALIALVVTVCGTLSGLASLPSKSHWRMTVGHRPDVSFVENAVSSSNARAIPGLEEKLADSELTFQESRQETKNIREIDFANFTYPATDSLFKRIGERQFTITNGSIERRDAFGDISLNLGISYLYYAKITNQDEADEAIVVLSYSAGGTGNWSSIYVYSLSGREPKLLWSFDAGDRSNGGLRDVYVEKKKLIIEIYKDTGLGACCANSIVRTAYQWKADRFQKVDEAVLEIQKTGAGPNFPLYNYKKK